MAARLISSSCCRRPGACTEQRRSGELRFSPISTCGLRSPTSCLLDGKIPAKLSQSFQGSWISSPQGSSMRRPTRSEVRGCRASPCPGRCASRPGCNSLGTTEACTLLRLSSQRQPSLESTEKQVSIKLTVGRDKFTVPCYWVLSCHRIEAGD